MAALRILNLRQLRQHPLRAVLAVVAVLAGTSLGLSVLIVTQSLSASVVRYSRAVAGPAPLRVIGADTSGGLEESVVGRVAATPGVSFAVPMVQAVSAVQQAPTLAAHRRIVAVLGVDCRVQDLVGPFGCQDPALRSSPTVVSADLSGWMGGRADLLTSSGPVPLAGALTLPQLDRLNQGRVVVLPLARAQALYDRPGRIDVISVGARPGTPLPALRSRLSAVVGPQNAVLGASDPPPQALAGTQALISLLSLMAILAAGISAVLIYNVLSLSLEERRRHNAVVAALGAPVTVMVAGPLVEAGLIGAAGGLLGAGGGAVVAGAMARTLSGATESAVGVPVTVHVSVLTFLVGMLFGALVAVGAALRPVRRSLRIDVSAELSGRDLSAEAAPATLVRRLLAPAVALGVAVTGCWASQTHGGLEAWQPTMATTSFLLLTLAAVLTSAAAAPWLVRAARRWAAGPLSRLGLANLARHPGRTGVMAVAVSATVGVAFITASWSRSVHDAILRSSATFDPTGVVVHMPRNGDVSGGFPAGTEARLAAVPGVARIDHSAGVLTGHTTTDLVGVVGVDRLPAAYDLLQGSASPAAFFRGEALVGPGIARTRHLRAGSLVTVDAPGGPVRLPVEGVWSDGDWTGNNVTVPLPLLQRFWGPVPIGSVVAVPAPGVSPANLTWRIMVAGLSPEVAVTSPDAAVAQTSRAVNAQLQPFWVLQRALMLVAFVAVLSTLLLAGVQRRREMAMLAAVGLRPSDLGGMVLAEGALVAAVGVVLGALFGVVGLYGMIETGPIVIGYRDPFRMAPTAFITYALVAAALVLAASALPSWRARRLPILDALRYE